MILPDKNITLANSLLGTGAVLLEKLNASETVSSLWEKVQSESIVHNYDKFVLTLDFLYMLDLVKFEDGLLKKKVIRC